MGRKIGRMTQLMDESGNIVLLYPGDEPSPKIAKLIRNEKCWAPEDQAEAKSEPEQPKLATFEEARAAIGNEPDAAAAPTPDPEVTPPPAPEATTVEQVLAQLPDMTREQLLDYATQIEAEFNKSAGKDVLIAAITHKLTGA